jgi:galactose mutarotase-like enzyme
VRSTKSPRFTASGGGRRLAVEFGAGYSVAQVYSPADADFICFEPMTAPTNALCSGDGLRWVVPGESFEASFRVSIEAA